MNTTIARPVLADFRPSLRASANRLVIAGRALTDIVAALDDVDPWTRDYIEAVGPPEVDVRELD